MTEAAPIQLWGSVQCKTFTYIGILRYTVDRAEFIRDRKRRYLHKCLLQ